MFEADRTRLLSSMLKLTTDQGHPNINDLWRVTKDINIMKLNIKNFGYQIARDLQRNLSRLPTRQGPFHVGMVSKATTQSDIESDWFSFWCSELKAVPIYHRKLWEFAFLLQSLFEAGVLRAGSSGIGFGCGQEPLASLFSANGIYSLVTDLEPEKVAGMGWSETRQHTSAREQAFYPDLVSKEAFETFCSHRFVDMNDIPPFDKQFDFCWSVCALEHLGSIRKGIDFILNSLSTLKPGGIAVHTTEFNYTSNSETIDNWTTVLFRERDFLELKSIVEDAGHEMLGPNFDIGDGVLDRFVDLPPFEAGSELMSDLQWKDSSSVAHLKLSIDGFPSTCFGILIRKRS